ncbi:Uncharacterised protein [Mycobacterium tuberculosis]|nr:Uncharacterised protein [Mycobacterium tuberculosis]
MPGLVTGAYPMLSAWEIRHAATDTSKSASLLVPPATEVNASSNPRTRPITSSSSSGRSTRGSIPDTRLRRSFSDAGSGSATSLATCSRPSSSTLNPDSPPATPTRPDTSRSAMCSTIACSASSVPGSVGSRRSVSAGPLAARQASPASSCARGSRHRADACA